ncbi:hypothetical protein [Rhodovastum atsumiense]|uniref:Uncharacterized protein n=1 Tax=Rhodovastum atsumiense TaxID=504468 RepID=A0A5M6ITJ3_9PROT|nr:hypothetical protein [Rhodovastum atsumiense]KAA5610868.1 hypothetical protein F1189_17490 [Rhodovastum atsumiense]
MIHWIAELLTDIIGWFDSKDKATVIVLGMILLCGAAGGWILWRHLVFRKAVESAGRVVRLALVAAGDSDLKRLNVISRDLAENATVSPAWRQYRAALRPNPLDDGTFVNSIDPRAWFVPERLGGHGYEKWITTWATVFLCLGLLFTFVGLSAALMKVGNVDDAVMLRAGINQILSVSSAKFITSIFGILLFVGWTFFGRWVAADQHAAVTDFAADVQELTTLVTPEVLLMDQLLASHAQGTRMQTLADDVATAFEARLNAVVGGRLDALPARLDAALVPVVDAIEAMSGGMWTSGDGALARMAERLEQAAEAIRATQAGFGQSGEAFGQGLAQATAAMTGTATRMAETIDDRLAGLLDRIGEVTEALDRSGRTIAAMQGGLEATTTTALRQAREQSEAALRPLFESLQLLAGQIRDHASKGSDQLVHGSRAAAGQLATAAQAMGEVLASSTREASGSLQKAAGSMAGRMEAAATQFQQLERMLAGHVGQLQKTGETINTAGTTFAAAATQVQKATEPVRSIMANVEASARQVAEGLKSAGQVHDGIRATAEIMGETSRTAGHAFDSYRGRFEATDQALERTFEKLVSGIREISTEGNRMVAEVQGQLATAVGQLRCGIEETTEVAGNVQAAADRFEAALARRAGAFAR